MRPVQNVFQKLSRKEQRREGVAAYLRGMSISLVPPLAVAIMYKQETVATGAANKMLPQIDGLNQDEYLSSEMVKGML